MFQRLALLIERLEENKISFGLWMIFALTIIFLRSCLESLVDYHKFPDVTMFDLLHVPVFFLAVLVSIIVVLHLFSKTPIVKVSQAAIVFFSVILLPVIVDLVFFFGRGSLSHYNYIFENPGIKFVNFFNPFFPIPEIPVSLRLEVAVVTVLSGVYIFIKTSRIGRSILGALVVFLVCFGFGSLPAFVINFFEGIIYPFFKSWMTGPVGAAMDERVIVILQLVMLALAAGVWYAQYDRVKWKAVVSNLRWTRAVHYLFLAVLGLKLQLVTSAEGDLFLFIKVLGLLLALFFAFEFAVIANDVIDVESDRRSNGGRPLVQGALNREEYLAIAHVFFVLALLLAVWVSEACFVMVLFYIAVAFLYSVPPFYLKRFFPWSVVIIGIESLIAFLIGQASFVGPGEIPIINAKAAWLVFLVFSLSANMKDLKDSEGDRAVGVMTLPILLGEKKGRMAVAACVGLSYLLVPFFLVPQYMHPWVSIIAGVFATVSFWYINLPEAKERNIFFLYFAFGIILLLSLKP